VFPPSRIFFPPPLPVYIHEECLDSVFNGVSLRTSLRVDGLSVRTLKLNSTFAIIADNRWNFVFLNKILLSVNIILNKIHHVYEVQQWNFLLYIYVCPLFSLLC
jgi:hypothetical protein